MTTKINKKDKLDAMLQMWTVLRHENRRRQFQEKSNDYMIMSALQAELASMLGITAKKLEATKGS